MRKCPDCKGKGIIEDFGEENSFNCLICNGRGTISDEFGFRLELLQAFVDLREQSNNEKE